MPGAICFVNKKQGWYAQRFHLEVRPVSPGQMALLNQDMRRCRSLRLVLLVHFVKGNSRLEVTHQTYRPAVYNYSEKLWQNQFLCILLFFLFFAYFLCDLVLFNSLSMSYTRVPYLYHVVSFGFSWHNCWPFDPLPGSYLPKLCLAPTDTKICEGFESILGVEF